MYQRKTHNISIIENPQGPEAIDAHIRRCLRDGSIHPNIAERLLASLAEDPLVEWEELVCRAVLRPGFAAVSPWAQETPSNSKE